MVGSCYFAVCGGRTEDRIDARRGLDLAAKTKKLHKNAKKVVKKFGRYEKWPYICTTKIELVDSSKG